MNLIRTYSELIKFPTLEERYKYLRIGGKVGEDTFGYDRLINQIFYRSQEWKDTRREIILRDNACDLGVDGYDILGRVIIHHMNLVTKEDILSKKEWLMDPEYLVCVSIGTHNAIHYGDESKLPISPIPRCRNDTCLWKGGAI